MADTSVGDIKSLISQVNSAISSVSQQLSSQSQAAANVQDFQKTVRKSSVNSAGFATDIGILTRGVSRLNVVSTLAKKDNVDFYKFRMTATGDVALGRTGDSGVRVQVMSKLGAVVADSDTKAGPSYDAYQKMTAGKLTLKSGDYTIRVSRDKGTAGTGDKNYALQLSSGSYSKDYDTVAKQPQQGDTPYSLSVGQSSTISMLGEGASALGSITYGQSATQKLLGSFSLFA